MNEKWPGWLTSIPDSTLQILTLQEKIKKIQPRCICKKDILDGTAFDLRKFLNLLDTFISSLLVLKIKSVYSIIAAPLLIEVKMDGQYMARRHWVNFSYPQKGVSLVSLSHKVAFTGVCPLQVAECIMEQPFFATLKNTWTCAASRPDSRAKLLSCKDLVMSVSILPDILHDM